MNSPIRTPVTTVNTVRTAVRNSVSPSVNFVRVSVISVNSDVSPTTTDVSNGIHRINHAIRRATCNPTSYTTLNIQRCTTQFRETQNREPIFHHESRKSKQKKPGDLQSKTLIELNKTEAFNKFKETRLYCRSIKVKEITNGTKNEETLLTRRRRSSDQTKHAGKNHDLTTSNTTAFDDNLTAFDLTNRAQEAYQ